MTAGVRQIVRFNWTRYAGAAATIAAIAWLIASVRMVASIETALIGAAIVIAFWTVASLGASWLVYDHSDLTRWAWIGDLFGNPAPHLAQPARRVRRDIPGARSLPRWLRPRLRHLRPARDDGSVHRPGQIPDAWFADR